MNKIGFLFLAVLYITVIFFFSVDIPVNLQVLMCGLLIALMGIPHGAIDNILFLQTSTVSPFKFYVSYLVTIGVYLLLWMVLPILSLVMFLLISAYHFGESQLSDYKLKKNGISNIVYMVWGMSILSGLTYFNGEEITRLFNSLEDLKQFTFLFGSSFNFYALTSAVLILVMCAYLAYIKRLLSLEEILKELYIFCLIQLSFCLLPALIGFTLYFVILHSTKVLVQEFNFLQRTSKKLTLMDFLKKLLPFTSLSLLGGGVFYIFIYLGVLNISYILLSIILISVITLPHAFVMQRFYTKAA